MPEMPHPGEDHGETCFIGRGDDLIVADRPTGLNHRGRTRFDSGKQADAQAYDSSRKKALKEIKTLLSIKD